MIFRNIFSGFSCESKGDSSDEFYARSSSRVELLRFSDARSPENRHSGLGRRRNRGWNFYVDFLLVSLFLLYLYKTKKERLLVAGKAGSASGIRRTSGAEYGRRPAGFRPGRERSRSRITRQMKTILSLVALLAATAGLRGQGGASADDSGPAPDALREWSVEETDALLSGLLAAYDDSWEARSRPPCIPTRSGEVKNFGRNDRRAPSVIRINGRPDRRRDGGRARKKLRGRTARLPIAPGKTDQYRTP